MEKHSEIVYRFKELEEKAEKLGLVVDNNYHSMSITNANPKVTDYNTNWVFYNFNTVEEGLAYLNGIETVIEHGSNFKDPIGERK